MNTLTKSSEGRCGSEKRDNKSAFSPVVVSCHSLGYVYSALYFDHTFPAKNTVVCMHTHAHTD